MGVALKASYATIYLERISQATSCLDRAPSSPIIGHAQILSVQRLGHLGRVWAYALQLKKFQAKFSIIIILANTRKVQSNVKAINLGCEQPE